MPQLINPHTWQHPSGIPLDLVGYQQQDQQRISGFWYQSPQHPWSRITYAPNVTLTKRHHPQFGNYWHPQDPQALLAVLFGPDWHTPKPDYDSLLHTQTLQDISLITQCYALKRIYWHWITQAFDKATALIEKSIAYQPTEAFFQTLLTAINQHQTSINAKQTTMKTITINNQTYPLDSLSEVAQQQLANIQTVDAELTKLQQQIAIYQTARNAYVQALVSEVEQNKPQKPTPKKRVSKAKTS